MDEGWLNKGAASRRKTGQGNAPAAYPTKWLVLRPTQRLFRQPTDDGWAQLNKTPPRPPACVYVLSAVPISHACILLTQPHSPRDLLCCSLCTHSNRTVRSCPLSVPAARHQASITSTQSIPVWWATCQAQQHSTKCPSPSASLSCGHVACDPVTQRQWIQLDQGPYSRSLPPGQHGSSPGAAPAPAGL
jgi:hypothetical protein